MTPYIKNRKRLILIALLFMSVGVFAQDSTRQNTIFYTFVFNEVPENFKYPIIGLINMAEGNQQGLQLGVSNLNQKNFGGVQIGFTNAAGGTTKGSQIGFVNATKRELNGAQIGYVNATGQYVKGSQIGFVNSCRDSLTGAHVGFVNVAGKKVTGAQVGFVNTCIDSIDGAQVGFVNVVVNETKGTQVGFVNVTNDSLNGAQVGFVNTIIDAGKAGQVGFVNVTTKTLQGTQIGFVNFADSIAGGVPLGFLSIVRKGGYHAVEVSASELYPANVAFKIGVKPLYTTFGVSYNPDFKTQFAMGAGLGSIVPISSRFYFNPEALFQSSIEKDHMQQFTSLTLNAGFTFSKHFTFVAGPTVVWSHKNDDDTRELFKPSFTLYQRTIDAQNNIHVGAKAALRFTF